MNTPFPKLLKEKELLAVPLYKKSSKTKGTLK